MGCDIHFFTERYTDDNIKNGPFKKDVIRDHTLDRVLSDDEYEPVKKWVSVDNWEFDGPEVGYIYWYVTDPFYEGRDYSLFGELANVRSYDRIKERDPRGIPKDASEGYLEICKQWEGDSHSHSYFTLKELLEMNFSYISDTFKETIKRMKKIDDDPNNIRCCFFFDN